MPKPPRGYWARVQAGQAPRRSPLAAFRAELDEERKAQWRAARLARLTPIQRQFFDCALSQLQKQGIDTSDCDVAYDGVRSIGADLAAQILLLIQNQYLGWMNEGLVSVQESLGARRSLSGLIDKLLPLAKEQVIVFEEQRRGREGVGTGRSS